INTGSTLTTDQRVALAAAEKDDVTYYDGSTVVDDPLAPGAVVTQIVINQISSVELQVSGSIDINAGANVYLGAEDYNLNIDHITAGQDVRIKSKAGVFNVAASGANVTAADLILEASATTIGTSSDDPFITDLSAGGTITARAGSDIYIEELSGNMNVDTMYSQSGGVYLAASNGSILDALQSGLVNIEANSFQFTASQGGIGQSGGYLELEILGSGTVTANARGDIYLEEVLSDMNVNSIVSTSGNVGLMANLSILNASGGIAAEVTGADISLDAINGNIGIAGNDLDIKATGTLTSSSYGNANIIQTDGDLSLNTVATVSGTAYISAPAGRILNGASSGYNIASGKTYLFAQNDIGTSANPITTQVGFLEGLSTLGAAYITNTGSMTIGGVTGSPTGFDTAGPLVISAMSPITIETSVSSGDDITITASDDDPG